MFVEKGKMKPCDICFMMKSGLMRVSKWCNCSVDSVGDWNHVRSTLPFTKCEIQ
jgi:hypothetical protein